MSQEKLFFGEFFKKYNILTSKGIQQRYLEAVKRRKKVELIKQYLLINVNGNDENVDIISIIDDNNEQRRVEKKREEKKIYGEFNNVHITDSELAKLKKKFGEENTKKKIESLSGYIASKGKKYNSHYATIITWAQKDDVKTKTEYSKMESDLGEIL